MDPTLNYEPWLEYPDNRIPTHAPAVPCDRVPVAPRSESGIEFLTEDSIVLNLIKEIPDFLLLDVKSHRHARCELRRVA
jgi:hypothetical protein